MERRAQAAMFAAAAATLGGLAVVTAARRRPRSTVPVRSTGLAARHVEMARLGARVGGPAAVNGARWVFASAARKEALNEELQLRTAEDVTETLGHMKGVFMKLGQIASFVDDGLPEPVRA